MDEIEALLYSHETCLDRYVKETQCLVSPSLNYTQGSYGHGGGNHSGSCGEVTHGGGNFGRGHDGGKFAKFQCQVCLKFGNIANVCHFRSNVSYQPHEFMSFIDHAKPQILGLILILSLETLLNQV